MREFQRSRAGVSSIGARWRGIMARRAVDEARRIAAEAARALEEAEAAERAAAAAAAEAAAQAAEAVRRHARKLFELNKRMLAPLPAQPAVALRLHLTVGGPCPYVEP